MSPSSSVRTKITASLRRSPQPPLDLNRLSPLQKRHTIYRHPPHPTPSPAGLVPMVANQQRHADRQRHAREYEEGALALWQLGRVVGAVDLVVHVVAVVVRPGLGDGLDDCCDVEEGAALCVLAVCLRWEGGVGCGLGRVTERGRLGVGGERGGEGEREGIAVRGRAVGGGEGKRTEGNGSTRADNRPWSRINAVPGHRQEDRSTAQHLRRRGGRRRSTTRARARCWSQSRRGARACTSRARRSGRRARR